MNVSDAPLHHARGLEHLAWLALGVSSWPTGGSAGVFEGGARQLALGFGLCSHPAAWHSGSPRGTALVPARPGSGVGTFARRVSNPIRACRPFFTSGSAPAIAVQRKSGDVWHWEVKGSPPRVRQCGRSHPACGPWARARGASSRSVARCESVLAPRGCLRRRPLAAVPPSLGVSQVYCVVCLVCCGRRRSSLTRVAAAWRR